MQSKLEKIVHFDPNGLGLADGNIYGLPFTQEESDIILLPVPWDVTTSYSAGTAEGPKAIFEASYQVDLYDLDFTDTWKKGIYMLPIDEHWHQIGEKYRVEAQMIIHELEKGTDIYSKPELLKELHAVNEHSQQLNQWVYDSTIALLSLGKKVGLVGGDHSTPLGYYKALAEHHDTFGILQIDAHADLREAYEGFTYSHASIMNNALELGEVSQLVQVGIRDICEAEVNMINNQPDRIKTMYQRDIDKHLYEGGKWQTICQHIIDALPEKVYVSFDIDGLDPKLCPNTGTPVPGGLEYGQVCYLLKMLSVSGKQIIGFDLCEVSPGSKGDEWDANVGARVLYKLCGLM